MVAIRESLGQSWGTVGAWTNAQQTAFITKHVTTDKALTWVRFDYYPNSAYSNGWRPGLPDSLAWWAPLDIVYDRAHAAGCRKLLTIVNTRSPGFPFGSTGFSTADGNFGTNNGTNSAAVTEFCQDLAAHLAARYPDCTRAYECGNEVELMVDAGGAHSISKYARLYSWMYPGLKAGDPAGLVSPGSPLHELTRKTASGALSTGSNKYASAIVAGSDAARTWSQTDWMIDGLTTGTTILNGSPSFVDTGFDFLIMHPYSIEKGPYGTFGGDGPGALTPNVPVNGLREIKYVHAVAVAQGAPAANCKIWATEVGFPTAPPWTANTWPAEQAVFLTAGSASPDGKTWTRGNRYRTPSSTSAVPPASPWVTYNDGSSAQAYNGFTSPSALSEENEAGQHTHNLIRIWFGLATDADNVNIGTMTGVLFYFQQSDEPSSLGFRYGLEYLDLSDKGQPTSAGPYKQLLAFSSQTDPRAGSATAPGQVTNLVASAGNGDVGLLWSAPPDGGSPITSYLVTISPTVAGNPFTALTTGISITGLSNGTTYSVHVHAVNAIGAGAESATKSFVPAAPPPPPPPPQITALPPLPTTDDLINNRRGTRADAFVFELLDGDLVKIGDLAVKADQAPTITFDASRNTSFRTCDNLVIPRGDLANINPLTDHVRVSVVLQSGDSFPLGVFRFGDNVRAPHTWGVEYSPSLFDDGWLIDQPTDHTFSLRTNTSVYDLIRRVVNELGFGLDQITIDAPDLTTLGSTVWRAGTSRYQILQDASLLLGCYPPFYDNAGRLRFRTIPDTSTPQIDRTYGKGDKILDATILETDDSFQAPNRYIVIGSSAKAEIIGIYDIPASAPQSFANRGVLVAKTVNVPSVPDAQHARASAKAAYLTDSRQTYVKVSFGSTLDPRHNLFDVLAYNQDPYVENGFAITCSSGGQMSHNAIRLWTDDLAA